LLRHARSDDELPAPAQCRGLCLGTQCDEQLGLQLRHVLPDVLSRDRASAGGNRHAQLQSCCPDQRIRGCANHLL